MSEAIPNKTRKWARVPLRDLLVPVSRPEMVDSMKTYKILGAHWYALGLYIKDMASGSEIRARELYRVERGDFIYNRLFGWKGAFAVAKDASHGCFVSNEFPCFRVNPERAEGEYIWKYFSLPSVWNEALSLSTGGTPTSRNRLKEDKFLSITIPLPAIEEQHRLVVRLDQMAALIQEARTIRHQSWLEADALSRSGRNKLFHSAAEHFGTSRLEELSSRITKGESPEWQGYTYQESGPVFIRSENVLWGTLDHSHAVHIPEPFHEKLSRSQLREGDVLINLVGASIGRTCAVPKGLGPANINQAVCVITPSTSKLLPDFLVHFLLSPVTQNLIHGGKVETARPNISLSDMRNLEIPTPPLLEQRRIISELDGLQAQVNVVKSLQAETASQLEDLMPSILDKAFRAEL